jgi:hypothetical protein
MSADRGFWQLSVGEHYRELATGLRELAAKCRLTNPRRELLNLARRFEQRANELERPPSGHN